MILHSACDPLPCGVFADISALFDRRIRAYLKIEAFNAAGSIKLKPARALVDAAEADGRLRPGATIIESSSGNMAVALALIAKTRGYAFVCVTDEKMTPHNRALVAAYGGMVAVLPGSTLDQREAHIAACCAADPKMVWTRQFHAAGNTAAHGRTTAQDILREFPRVDTLLIGTGTGGTLAGCAAAFAQASPATRIVAVDAAGSHLFGPPDRPARRTIPGIGATRPSVLLQGVTVDRVVAVSEPDTIAACRLLCYRTGWLMGGSTGSVVAAALALAETFTHGETMVCVAADMGERYLDSIYAG